MIPGKGDLSSEFNIDPTSGEEKTMKKKGVVFFAAGMAVLFILRFVPVEARPTTAAAFGQSAETNVLAEKQFAEAVTFLKQENFSDAIAAYEKVIALSPESAIAQDAQYWIGQTYFRMGKYDEALSVFKRLLHDYPGSAIVPVTRLMLARVENERKTNQLDTRRNAALDHKVIVDPKTGVEFRKMAMLVGKKDLIVYPRHSLSLSPNGRFLLYDNTVIPLGDRESFEIEGMEGDAYSGVGGWSPDGKKIAFNSSGSLRVIPVSPETGLPAGIAQRLTDDSLRVLGPLSWSPDSEKIAFSAGESEEDADIYLLSLNNASVTRITNEPILEVRPLWFPDGKNIAYIKGNREIWVISPDGTNPKKLLDHGSPCFFSPDGKWLLFYKGAIQYLCRISEGWISPLRLPEGVEYCFGWSADSKKLLFYTPSFTYACQLKVMSASGGPSFELGRGLSLYPYGQRWSPDSKLIITDGTSPDSPWTKWIITLSGGDNIELKLDLPVDGSPISLSPDCRSLLFGVELEGEKQDLYVVPVSLEAARTTGPPVKVFSERDISQKDEWTSWSPDGKKLAVSHNGDTWVVSSKGGRAVQLTKSADRETHAVWSPDGKMIAYIKNPVLSLGELQVIPVVGGEPVKISDSVSTRDFAWSRDGTELVFVPEAEKLGDPRQIWSVKLAGFKKRKILDAGSSRVSHSSYLRFSPDGQKIAFGGHRIEKGKRGGVGQIFLIPFKGGEVTNLTPNDPLSKYAPHWSPDGKWISYGTDDFIKTRPAGTLWEATFEDLIKSMK